MGDRILGTALVADVNDWLLETMKPYTLRATLVVEADGVPKTTVEHSEIVNADWGDHLDKWPSQGDTIPVTIDRADPSRVQIEWDGMRGKSDRLREAERTEAEQRKQQLIAQAYDTSPTPTSASPPTAGPLCATCQTANPEGTTFCRSCGGLLR